MLLLSLKTIAWNETHHGFFSPSHRGFMWEKDVIVAGCEHVEVHGQIGMDCTCGIHSSPNARVLKDYQHFPNSVIVLLSLYGMVDTWTGPKDLPNTYVVRSWGAQVVGVAKEEFTNKQRFMSSVLAAQCFEVAIEPLEMLEAMIQSTWKSVVDIDPYQPERRAI